MSDTTVYNDGYCDGYNKAQVEFNEQNPAIREGSEEHRLDIAFDEVRKTLDGRNLSYKVPPAEYVDIEILIAQMVLKAERARQAVGVEKQIDEVRDTAGYAMLILGRLLPAPLSVCSKSECNQNQYDDGHRCNKSKEEFSMFSDGYHQALKDNDVNMKMVITLTSCLNKFADDIQLILDDVVPPSVQSKPKSKDNCYYGFHNMNTEEPRSEVDYTNIIPQDVKL